MSFHGTHPVDKVGNGAISTCIASIKLGCMSVMRRNDSSSREPSQAQKEGKDESHVEGKLDWFAEGMS